MTLADRHKARHINPLLSANFIQKLFIWWLKDLLQYGNKHDLKDNDIYETLPEDQSQNLGNQLEKTWNIQLNNAKIKNKEPSLWATGISVFGWEFVKCASLRFVGHIFIEMSFPLLLECIISYFKPNSSLNSEGAYLVATVFVILLFSNTLLIRYAQLKVNRLGMHVKIACSTLIFRKITRLSLTENKAESIINLLSNDLANIETLFVYLQFFIIIPVQSITLTLLMSRYVGIVTAVTGTLLMALMGILGQVWRYSVTRKLRAKQTIETDRRIHLISEIISGIRAIKMYVWENYFKKLVDEARRREIAIFLKIGYVNAFIFSAFNFFYHVCTYLMVMIYTLKNQLVTTTMLIPMMNILWTLNGAINGKLFASVMALVDAKVSIKRVESFLISNEVRSTLTKNPMDSIHDTKNSISINDVNVSWNSKMIEKVLDNINIDINRNQLCVITGPVGSGKSTLMKLILGELSFISGEVRVNGKVSYSDQQPWIFKKSIKDNIVFSDPYDEERYHQVVEACTLSEDFDQLPYGDKTILDENGTLLSGGQRTRVHLARAVYRDVDIYLLDDPFASVDVQVARQLFKNCICNLLKNKTRVLVTSSLQYITHADMVVELNNGKIEYQGPFSKSQLSNKYLNDLQKNNVEKLDLEENYNDTSMPVGDSLQIQNNDEPKETEELLRKGKISNSLVKDYIQASQSYPAFFSWVSGCVLIILLFVSFDYWMVTWTQEQERIYANITNFNSTEIVDVMDSNKFLLSIGGLVVTLMIVSIFTNFLFYRITLIASRTIHEKMFACLIKGPLKFFQLNSQGRILNRFSEDTGNVDNSLPKMFNDAYQSLLKVITLLLSITIINIWFLIPICALSYINYKIYKFYVPTIRSIRRLAGAAKSPVLSSAASCFTGVLTVRSCHAEKLVTQEFNNHQDHLTAAQYLSIACSTSFVLSIDMLTNVLFAFTIYNGIFFKDKIQSAGYLGLCLEQIIKMIWAISFAMENFTSVLSYTINLERILQFTKLEIENSIESENEMKVPSLWPSKGELLFQHIYLRYSDEVEPTLKDVNFVIAPGDKVGIVGRTGAGKSSLISVLFRLAKYDGSVLIDEVDIKNIDLLNLRSKISIIPQEPTLFNTTLRNNLDPLNTVDDATLWSALEDVQLKSIFDSLQYKIDKNGGNLSFGQRQLICLARAIIKKNQILVLDEATSNVDPATDELIQETIRLKFNGCTVLTIAHKLITVMDCDKVLVMENGQVLEYEHPHLLLQNKDSHFSEMVNQMNNDMAEKMKTIARKACNKD